MQDIKQNELDSIQKVKDSELYELDSRHNKIDLKQKELSCERLIYESKKSIWNITQSIYCLITRI